MATTGAASFYGGSSVDLDKFTAADGTGNTATAGTLSVGSAVTVTGATALNGGLTMDTDKFTAADGMRNTAIAGTLTATGSRHLV